LLLALLAVSVPALSLLPVPPALLPTATQWVVRRAVWRRQDDAQGIFVVVPSIFWVDAGIFEAFQPAKSHPEELKK
jgi:hypothetical protein